MKTNFSKFIGGLFALVLVALFIAIAVHKARAQPYFTNSTSNVFGAYQYNQNFSTPLYPSRILAAQYAAGTLAGVGTEVTGANAFTNTFGTNIFSTAPFVVANASVTNVSVAVTSVTTTNFVLTTSVANVTLYWEATGH